MNLTAHKPKCLSPDSRIEDQLLVSCARTQIDCETAKRIRHLVGCSIDWTYLLHVARQQAVSPLLYHSLTRVCPERVPAHIAGEFRAYVHSNTARNILLTRELVRLIKRLEEEGIRAVPYKGPVLAETIYADLALREFSDLDLVIQACDLPRAKKLLLSEHYRWVPFEGQSTGERESDNIRTWHEYAFKHVESGIDVDLHWRITPQTFRFPLDLERVWDQLESVTLGGMTVFSFPPEQLLLMLSVHGAKDLWSTRLSMLCDIAELIRARPGIDWNAVIRQASELGVLRMLFVALRLVSDVLDADLPVAVDQRVREDAAAGVLAARVKKDLLQKRRPLAKHLFRLQVRERWQDKVLYLPRLARGTRRVLFKVSAQDKAFLHLPHFLSFLYPMVRLLRLTRKHVTRPARPTRG